MGFFLEGLETWARCVAVYVNSGHLRSFEIMGCCLFLNEKLSFMIDMVR